MIPYQFAYPWILWFLLLIPILAFFRGKQGKDAAVQYSALSLFGPLARSSRVTMGAVAIALRYFSLAFLIIALARPQTVNSTVQVEESGIDIMLAIDLSPSMNALDYFRNGQELNRVTVVKEAVTDFIRDRPNDRIGMVVFAGQAFLMSPLTLDHEWLLQNVDSDRFKVGLAGDATAIGSALAVCANRLRHETAKSKIIVLLTDGANNSGKITPMAAAEAAAALGIKIYTIGAGSADKAKYPVEDGAGNVRYIYIPVDMDENALRKIAEIGNGKFFRAKDTDSMMNVYKIINSLEKTKLGSHRVENVVEYFMWFAYPAVFFLGSELAFSNMRRWRKLP